MHDLSSLTIEFFLKTLPPVVGIRLAMLALLQLPFRLCFFGHPRHRRVGREFFGGWLTSPHPQQKNTFHSIAHTAGPLQGHQEAPVRWNFTPGCHSCDLRMFTLQLGQGQHLRLLHPAPRSERRPLPAPVLLSTQQLTLWDQGGP